MNNFTQSTLNPAFSSSSPNLLTHCPSNHTLRLVQDSISAHGFCNSCPNLSKSVTKIINRSDSIRVRNKVGSIAHHHIPKTFQDSFLAYGFCKSAKRVLKSMSSSSIRVRSEVGLNDDEGENDDGFYMRRCVEIARKAIGCTSPNPMVGCVLVREGKIVGEGFHPKAGQPHAEVFALREAGDLAENSTAYVSLEPCNHYGRTPPCSEALIKAKIKKVVIGMVDPNPIVDSKGIEKLRNAGIEVKVGVEEELCKKLNEAFIHQMLNGRPFVTLRYSLNVNGGFSNQLGEEATKSGGYYSKLLQEYDAIILSSSLLIENSTFPSSSEPEANQPLKIIISKNSLSAIQVPELSQDEISKVIIFADRERVVEPETAQKGIETVVLDKISLVAILEYCKNRGLCSVLLDLRGNIENFEEVLEEGCEQNLFQKVVIEMLPVWDESMEESLPKSLRERKKLRNLTSRNSGKSIVLEGYF